MGSAQNAINMVAEIPNNNSWGAFKWVKSSVTKHTLCKHMCVNMHVCVHRLYIDCMLSDTDEFGGTWSNFVLGLLCIWVKEKLENKFRGSRSPADRGFLRCSSKETRWTRAVMSTVCFSAADLQRVHPQSDDPERTNFFKGHISPWEFFLAFFSYKICSTKNDFGHGSTWLQLWGPPPPY